MIDPNYAIFSRIDPNYTILSKDRFELLPITTNYHQLSKCIEVVPHSLLLHHHLFQLVEIVRDGVVIWQRLVLVELLRWHLNMHKMFNTCIQP